MDMDEKSAPRTPKQSRSIKTKEKVLAAGYRLFCAKGYYNTTTNEIAREAGVPIGSLYAYFSDKDTIFVEILKLYHQEFTRSSTELIGKMDVYTKDVRAWLTKLVESLIKVHEHGKELNRETQIVCFSNPEVAELMKRQRQDSYSITLEFFKKMKDSIDVLDVEAAAMVTFDTISAVVDRIVFGEYGIEKSRIIKACVEEVYRYLYKQEK
jgi:AcrR family transcriptional regulator